MPSVKSKNKKMKTKKFQTVEGGGIRIRGFSLVELIVVVVIIGILSVVSYTALQSAGDRSKNNKVIADLQTIAASLDSYKRDNEGAYPVPNPDDPVKGKINQNVLCYYEDATYAHSCDKNDALFVQGMIDNSLLTKRYLRDVPVDPRTGNRYSYGVTTDGAYFQVAGIYKEDDDTFTARTSGNLAKGFRFPSLIRSYNSPEFITDKKKYLPYSPNRMEVTGSLANITGTVKVNGTPVTNEGFDVGKASTVSTVPDGTVDIYFSDGSITHVDKNTTLVLKELKVMKNDKSGTSTSVVLGVNVGKIWNKVARLSSKSEFNVETTSAIAGVRGTEFGVDMAAGGSFTTTVFSGEVGIYANKVITSLPTHLLTSAKPFSITESSFNATGASKSTPSSPSSVSSIITSYYKDIPLSINMTPRILTAGHDSMKKGIITIRDINYYADLVNKELSKQTSQTITRKVDATDLAVYTNGTGAGVPAKTIKLAGKTPPYTIEGLLVDTPYYLRFEKKTVAGKVLRSSGLTIPITIKKNTNLTESEIYSNQTSTIAALTANPPALDLRAPRFASWKIGTQNPSVFNVSAEIVNYKIPTAGLNYTVAGNSFCTPVSPPPGTQSNTFSFKMEVLKKVTGKCEITVATTIDGKSLSQKASVNVIKPTQRLVLKYPKDKAQFNPSKTKNIVFKWDARGVPSSASYKITINGTPYPVQSNFYPPTGTHPLSQGTYNWKVELMKGNEILEGREATFTVGTPTPVVNLADFTVNIGSTPVLIKGQNQKTISASGTAPMQFAVAAVNTTLPANHTYEWNISPSFSSPTTPQTIASFSATIAPPATTKSKYGSITLTVRDNTKGIIAGTVTKGITIASPTQIISVSFPTTNLTIASGKFNIPNLTATPSAAGPITPDKCSALTVPAGMGQVTKTPTTAAAPGTASYTPSSTASGNVKITCRIDPGTQINGYIVGSTPITDNVDAVVSAAGPKLAQICKPGSGGKMIGTECWAKGSAGQSCTQVCQAIKLGSTKLSCKDSTTTPGMTDWNADKSVCSSFGGTVLPLANNALENSYSPLMFGLACKVRHLSPLKTIPKFKCSNSPKINTPPQPSPFRLCKCVQ